MHLNEINVLTLVFYTLVFMAFCTLNKNINATSEVLVPCFMS